jgi:hypothetical protein
MAFTTLDMASAVAGFSRRCQDGTAIWPCLVGETGTGKTARARELAKRLGCEAMEVVLLGTELPHDVLGLPRVRGSVATHLVAERWVKAAERPTLVLLDELDKADRDCVAAVLTLLSERRVYNLVLHPQTAILCAMQPPQDLTLWRDDQTLQALAARLCFLGVSHAEAWTVIQAETGIDFAPLYGAGEVPPLPLLAKPSPRQVLWLTRFALAQADPAGPLVQAVAAGIVASSETIQKHLTLLAASATSRVRISLLAQDEAIFLKWIEQVATLADLASPDVIRTLLTAASPRPLMAAAQRLWLQGSPADQQAFLNKLTPALDDMAKQQGTPGQAKICGSVTSEEVAMLLRESSKRVGRARPLTLRQHEWSPTRWLSIPASIDAEVAAWIQARVEPTTLPIGAGVVIRDGRIRVLVDPVFWAGLSDEDRALVLKQKLLHVLQGHLNEPPPEDAGHRLARQAACHCAIDWSLGCPDLTTLEARVRACYPQVAAQRLSLPWANGSVLDQWTRMATWLGLDPLLPPPAIRQLTELIAARLPRLPVPPDLAGYEPGAPTPETELDRAELSKACQDSQDPDLRRAASGLSPDLIYTPAPIQYPPIHHRGLAALLETLNRVGSLHQRQDSSWQREGRFPLLPGICRLRALRLVVCVDTSNSISDTLVARYAAVLRGTLRGWEIAFAEFTKQVFSHGSAWRGRQHCGGTCFGPALAWAARQRPDAVVMMTDGHPADRGTPTLLAPVLWVLPRHHRLRGWALRPGDRVIEMDQ